ncbi:uncharacterized protein LOC107217741 [Neodiprion lecontei]|uniref:Mitochondria-eating protein n=1 Tax=Neodiprion lecontei TaxID=441921 RepID=A0A6J0BAZ0_NEOLC|nr:uncharacterized protein LOC107217741 [Neodiprion lecontei]XP_046596674.1 uncharacterized protein LOC107217741 [Neodiprion lecontei]XP_046596678.1 uncharacterized protein LOC107217741 [Neodiprion lecontei]XP_046596682.1 uncharacterized protein LOC107217741 [Neodiprion lecontei]
MREIEASKMSKRTLPLAGLNSCERIRPERPRNPIQRLVWSGAQFQVGPFGSLEDEASNPRMALRRLLKLYEGRQYREAASFLSRIPVYTLKAALPDIPVDLLVDALPHSLALLETLYSRLAELSCDELKVIRVEPALWKIVYLISTSQDHFHVRIWTKLLAALSKVAPGSKAVLATRKRALERAVEGLGKHGLVPSSQLGNGLDYTNAQNLVSLPVALKEELEARSEAYKLALHKIENFQKHTGTNKGGQGVQAASHQRQLSLKYSEIQQRLINNQGLLNTLEKATSPALENLLRELKHRVEYDKEALRQWTALRKSNFRTNTKNPPLAARLLQCARGCGLALQLMSEEIPREVQASPIVQENTLDDYEEESSSAGYHTDESGSPTPEPGDPSGGDCSYQGLPFPADMTVSQLVERYGSLYAQAQLHTLDALDALEPLKDAPDLKAKILYSVVVLSWRLAGMIQTARRFEAIHVLNGTQSQQTGSSAPSSEFEDCIRRQLATFGARTGLSEVSDQVLSQLERTLYDFPCLRSCPEIRDYANSCASLAWACLARSTPLVLDVAQGVDFQRELHARHHGSPDPNGVKIRSVLWPGLREGCQGRCLHRAVVLTN